MISFAPVSSFGFSLAEASLSPFGCASVLSFFSSSPSFPAVELSSPGMISFFYTFFRRFFSTLENSGEKLVFDLDSMLVVLLVIQLSTS